MNMKKSIAIFISCLALVGVMTGCGNTEDASSEPTTEVTTEATTEAVTTTEAPTTEAAVEDPETIINTFAIGDSYSVSGMNGLIKATCVKDSCYITVGETVKYFNDGNTVMAIFTNGSDTVNLKAENDENVDPMSTFIGFNAESMFLEYNGSTTNDNEYQAVAGFGDGSTEDCIVVLKDNKISELQFNNGDTVVIVDDDKLATFDYEGVEFTDDEFDNIGASLQNAILAAITGNLDENGLPSDPVTPDESPASNSGEVSEDAKTVSDIEISGYQNIGSQINANNYDENMKLITYTFKNEDEGKKFIEEYEAAKEAKKTFYISAKVTENGGEDWFFIEEYLGSTTK